MFKLFVRADLNTGPPGDTITLYFSLQLVCRTILRNLITSELILDEIR